MSLGLIASFTLNLLHLLFRKAFFQLQWFKYVLFGFQSLYAKSPSDVKELLKIVLTSKGKLHGQDIAPRYVSS